MAMNPYCKANFLKSAAKISQLPEDIGYEVAFVGRSNAGKSSALNTLTHQKQLAKTSKTPGRTQLINLFTLDETRRLVDLPGYGYAKVNLEVKAGWQKTLGDYLSQRQCLKGLIVLMDIRHPLKELDEMLIDFALSRALPVHILLTKADKVSRSEGKNTLNKVKNALGNDNDLISLQLFSSLKKEGIDELISRLNFWYEMP